MFRIRKEAKGYIVEVKTYKWTLFGLKKVWKPYILTNGMDYAWHHNKVDYAIMNFKNQIYRDLLENTNFQINK